MIYPLIIANNPMSNTLNNGKTIASFFSSIESESITQLYFINEAPLFFKGVEYYLISDNDALRNKPGSWKRPNEFLDPKQTSFTKHTKKGHFLRILREMVWLRYNWKNKNQAFFDSCSKKDFIFFCAGDTLFPYRMVSYLKYKYNLPIITYITDDYIYPQKKWNIFALFRRRMVRTAMLDVCKTSTTVFTISNKMSRVYHEKYGIQSQVLANISNDNYKLKTPSRSYPYKLVYAGGLHLSRDKVLAKLITAIIDVNSSFNEDVFSLEIYSPHMPSELLERLKNINSSCHYMGVKSDEELASVFSSADILVFVEDSDRRSISATWLSLSTKVPEYLSYGKLILNIGPRDANSVDELYNYSCYASDNVESIKSALLDIFNNPKLFEIFSERSYGYYRKEFAEDKVRDRFIRAVNLVLEEK